VGVFFLNTVQLHNLVTKKTLQKDKTERLIGREKMDLRKAETMIK